MSLVATAQRSADLFAKCFGQAPRWIIAAPGRVNLIGEHTDYSDGFVLPMAIDRYTVVAAGPASGRTVTAHSETTGETASFNLRLPITPGEPSWSNYVRGVVAAFLGRKGKLSGFNAAISSEVPYGGGLGSSAALEVAVATLLETMQGVELDPLEKALLCQRAEHDFAGVPCGIMDQYTSIMAREGHALLLDCRSRTSRPVALTDTGITVLVVNTNVRHRLAESEYPKRRAQCEAAARALGVPALRDATMRVLTSAQRRLDAVVFRRARHVITENERTLKTAEAIEAANWEEVGRLMYASHASLRDDYQVSCAELDTVVEAARQLGPGEGVIGCRMTGGGFGGCAVGLVRTGALRRLTRKLEEAYERRTRNQAAIFCCRPGGGAQVLKGE